MRTLGLDVGSRTVDAVWLDAATIAGSAVVDSGFDPVNVARRFVEAGEHDVVVATGYGRHAMRAAFGAAIISEVKAFAVGARALFPDAACVLDIGGQDTKVIALGADGRVIDFEMNDRCAAGTGKFLEIMARALGYELEEMAAAAMAVTDGARISSMCTVFAESEVTALVHRGEDRRRIARGLHEAIARRTLGSLKRVATSGPLVFGGGVARNLAMIAAVRAGFVGPVFVPDNPQTVGALGAALSAVCDVARPM